eukprot:c19555_g1_i1 orf=377-1117(-)
MTGRVAVTKSGSVREERFRDSVVTRFSSVREHGSRDGAVPYGAMNLPVVEVGARGSISALMDHDVRSRDDFRSLAERPAEQAISRSDRWWLLGSRRQSRRSTELVLDRNKKDGDNDRNLETVDENGGKMPRWKRLLRKFKREAKKRNESDQDKSHPSHGGDRIENGQIQYESLRDKQEINGAQLQGQTQKPLIYCGSLPLPLPNPRQEPTTSIWERRKVEQPSPLDLSKVKIPAPRRGRVKKAHPK